jgi:hypothetical protein
MASTSTANRLAKKAQFVFRGTVRTLKAATMPELPTDDRTAIVTVDEILQAPSAFSVYAGKEITVQLGGRKKLSPGQEAVFFANSWRFGDGVAVRSIDQLPPSKRTTATRGMTLAMAPHGLGTPRSLGAETLATHELERQVEKADLVVTGRVASVRVADEIPPALSRTRGFKAAPNAPAQPARISEHDPLWCEATVDVAGNEKEGIAAKQIVVRFPSSRDVRWYKVPKFTPGEEGVFLLHKAEPPTAPAAAARLRGLMAGARAAEPEVYTVEDPADFQPMHRAAAIRALVRPGQTPVAAVSGKSKAKAVKATRARHATKH